MSFNLRTWGSAIALASALVIASSCAKKADNTAQTGPVSSAQSAPQPAPPSVGGAPANPASAATNPPPAPDKMAPAPSTATPEPGRATAPPPAQVAEAEPPPPPPQPATFTIPAGASVSVRTISSLSTKTNQTGQPFSGTLAAPLKVNGVIIARTGSGVSGTIVDSDSGGRVKGVAALRLAVTSITTIDGQRLPVTSSSFEVLAKSTKKKDAAKIGGAAAVGTVIGAIAGGGKGAAIGAVAGGGAGTGVVLATKGDPAVLPSESIINVRLSNSVRVTERNPGTILKIKAPPAAPAEPPPPPNQ